MYKRYVEKRNGENVIPLRNAICGIDMPKWELRTANDNEMFLSGEAVDKLAELEDKIENGTLVELPCKVGTTIYHLYKAGNVITEDKVFNYHFEICTKPCVSFENHFWFGTNKRVDTILVEQFGKYWFLTKAEAEKKLKELK